jgi:hypothetical protein
MGHHRRGIPSRRVLRTGSDITMVLTGCKLLLPPGTGCWSCMTSSGRISVQCTCSGSGHGHEAIRTTVSRWSHARHVSAAVDCNMLCCEWLGIAIHLTSHAQGPGSLRPVPVDHLGASRPRPSGVPPAPLEFVCYPSLMTPCTVQE